MRRSLTHLSLLPIYFRIKATVFDESLDRARRACIMQAAKGLLIGRWKIQWV
eukprot:SAG11_NODE_11761_length_739_cov_2.392187_1_plen_51_part_10